MTVCEILNEIQRSSHIHSSSSSQQNGCSTASSLAQIFIKIFTVLSVGVEEVFESIPVQKGKIETEIFNYF